MLFSLEQQSPCWLSFIYPAYFFVELLRGGSSAQELFLHRPSHLFPFKTSMKSGAVPQEINCGNHPGADIRRLSSLLG